jgi:hypothetical protein
VVHRGAEVLGRLAQPLPSAMFADLELELPAGLAPGGTLALLVSAEQPESYRSFHYFVTQPVR